MVARIGHNTQAVQPMNKILFLNKLFVFNELFL